MILKHELENRKDAGTGAESEPHGFGDILLGY